jgi:hypothetical protein
MRGSTRLLVNFSVGNLMKPVAWGQFLIHSSDASMLKDFDSLYLIANNTQSGNKYVKLGEWLLLGYVFTKSADGSEGVR